MLSLKYLLKTLWVSKTWPNSHAMCKSATTHASLCNACLKSQVWCDMTLSAISAQSCSSAKFRSKTRTIQTTNKARNKQISKSRNKSQTNNKTFCHSKQQHRATTQSIPTKAKQGRKNGNRTNITTKKQKRNKTNAIPETAHWLHVSHTKHNMTKQTNKQTPPPTNTHEFTLREFTMRV